MTDQPTLTDGVVTLRPWREDDIDEAVAGHDEEIAFWFGFPVVRPTREVHAAAVERWRTGWRDGTVANFVVEHAGRVAGCVELRRGDEHTAELSWATYSGHRGQGLATRAVRMLGDFGLSDRADGGLGLSRVEAKVEPDNLTSIRVATRSGLRREGVRRVVPGTGDRQETSAYVVLARLSDDPPLSEPTAFRALLNSFLPRKRAISQLLIRDDAGRVLLCQLTYKHDWDLPGGVVEVGESPQHAVTREIEEELGLALPAGRLLLTDWLPPWSGWDDALCLVFDGGAHDAALTNTIVRQPREIRDAAFCSLDEVHERCADFTARRVEAALANVGGGAPAYTESGRR